MCQALGPWGGENGPGLYSGSGTWAAEATAEETGEQGSQGTTSGAGIFKQDAESRGTPGGVISSLYLLIFNLMFMYMSACPHGYVCATGTFCPGRSEEGVRPSRAGIMCGWL